MPVTDQELAQAVENCSRDPVHIPGKIQAFGMMIATDAGFNQILFISQNISGAQDLVGAPVSAFFSVEEIHAIRNAVGSETIESQRIVTINKHINDLHCQLSLHAKGDHILVECIPEQIDPMAKFGILERARDFLLGQLDFADLDAFLEDATTRLRAINDYDRVMFYRFLPNGSGEVIAEALNPTVESYLGLRFPPSDIPVIARKLYAKTPIRVLADVPSEDVPVLGVEGAETLDMSLALLRGKDPVHQRYLINMGVRASQTISVVVRGELWGLFACHNMQPKTPDPAGLAASELAGQLISLQIEHALEVFNFETRIRCSGIASRLVVADDSKMSATEYWADMRYEIADLIACDGIIFAVDGKLNSHGVVPPLGASQALLALADPEVDRVFAVDDLQKRLPGAVWGDTGGALIIAMPGRPSIQIAFLRNLTQTHVRWAGQPEKTVTLEEEGPKLHPRHSFEAYLRTSDERSDEWTATEIETAQVLRGSMMDAILTQSELRENRHRMGLLVRELNHRVRNILALVQSLSQQSRDNARSVETYAETLESRIIALSGAHDLLTKADMKGAMLRDLLELELKPFNGSRTRFELSGPNVGFRPDVCSVLALVFHELTSNAAKYGALSSPEGHVNITWALARDGVELRWKESGGPKVTPPEQDGFGTTIISSAIPYELNGEAKLTFPQDGVDGQFWLPGDTVTDLDFEVIVAPTLRLQANHDAPRQTTGRLDRVMVVEDNFIVAMQAKRMLGDCGIERVDAASTVEEALAFIEANQYDFCLLDVNLNGKLSTPVATRLDLLGIPFAFATGYGSDGLDIVGKFDVPVLSKPLDLPSLRRVLPDPEA
ncbi:HWE histidine kinase domain-containing protein [Aestuariivita sp.]|uniref:HWE histidine kinase domain-containing protein n=1 Tax=Aestuariivita sp. TaxID=1872407 RepID=UPI00216CF9E5|nr:HWE histidine kinase domain-containing protein [Aestuariivita sp.]MCE8007774.1 GAF domain-containing protein [Aestuariivita sp.]